MHTSRSCRNSAQRGSSLLEVTLVMAVAAILLATGTALWDTDAVDLIAAQREIRSSVEEAFILARARGTDVKVALGSASGAGGHLPVQLSRKVLWGKPAGIPLPPGMDTPLVAARTGESHPIITVTPRHTTLASAWFLNNGKEAVCMRLSDHGHLQVLRWRRDLKKWTRA